MGSIGLLKAIRSFNPEKAKFSTFAWYVIKNEILRYINTQNKQTKNCVTYYNNEHDRSYIPEEDIDEYIPNSLTNQQKSIVKLKVKGHTNDEIAKEFQKTKYWVDYQIKKIYKEIKQANEKEKSFTG